MFSFHCSHLDILLSIDDSNHHTRSLSSGRGDDPISRKRRAIKLADWEELDSIFRRDRVDLSYVRWSRRHRADILEHLLHPTWYQNDESLTYGIPGILESVRYLSWYNDNRTIGCFTLTVTALECVLSR